MKSQVIEGNNIDVLNTFPDDHFDSIVTDPPYGIDFLGKSWDANTGALETYQECLRVLKPGGHILAFSAARTYHHLAVTIEQAGFEIRDQIMWIYSSGFPKSQDVGRSIQRSLGVEETKAQKGYNGFGSENGTAFTQDWDRGPEKNPKVICTDPMAQRWEGWGTALKPAHEPIVMARKPIRLSIAKNCQQWGVGALNIDAGRIPTDEVIVCGAGNSDTFNKFNAENNTDGPGTGTKINVDVPKWTQADGGRFPSNVLGDIPDYQKYFYCPKVSRRERHMGFDTTNIATNPAGMYDADGTGQQYNVTKKSGEVGNNHPTVKPIELMKYLIKLVTPPGGHVLDPFNGSGSTGCAAVELDYDYTGIELDARYVAIATKRIAAWYAETHATTFAELFETCQTQLY